MKRIRTSVYSVGFAVGLLALSPLNAQVTVTDLGQGIHLIQTQMPIDGKVVTFMNNLLLVGEDGVVLVDTMMEENEGVPLYPVLRYLGINQVTTDPVDVVISTSWHYDHVGLNATLVNVEGTKEIIGHWRTPQFLSTTRTIEDLGWVFPPAPVEAWPNRLVHGTQTRQFNGQRITLKTVENAHSDSDLVVYLPDANIVYTGDIFFGGLIPIIDRSSGGSVNGTLHACRQVLAQINEETLVIPSHGNPGGRQDVAAFVDTLETCRARMRHLIREGLSEEEVIAAQPFGDLSDWDWFATTDLLALIFYRDMAPSR